MKENEDERNEEEEKLLSDDSDSDLSDVEEDTKKSQKNNDNDDSSSSSSESEDEVIEEDNMYRLKHGRYIKSMRSDKSSEKPWIEVDLKLHYVNTDIGSIFQSLAEKTKIREVPGISRAFIRTNKNTGTTYLDIEGINIEKVFDRGNGLLDLNSLYSNDIEAIRNFYGIDAAVLVIQREIKAVFGVYSIEIDPRHLSMIADYMCTTGAYLGFNRRTLFSSKSPWLQMSFEAAISGLQTCLMQKKSDDMKSPSARIVAGQTLLGLSEPIYTI